MNAIPVTLSENEWEAILNALAYRPFGEVYALVNKIHAQIVDGRKEGIHEKD